MVRLIASISTHYISQDALPVLTRYISHDSSLPATRPGAKMATCGGSEADRENIPDYEYIDVNTKAFHIGAFRDLWLERLKPADYSYKEEEDDVFEADFAKELGLDAETVNTLKSICR